VDFSSGYNWNTMTYQFAKERSDYSHLSSGRVFYSLPGYPAFPVRLASEIFQRCIALREARNLTTPCVLYDPCCGAAYHLSVLAYLHWEHIQAVIASDADPEAVRLAAGNLRLLSLAGLDRRTGEITEMLRQYGKESHQQALDSAMVLRDRIAILSQDHPIQTLTFQANALDASMLSSGLEDAAVDIVFTDIPYGLHSHWLSSASAQDVADPLRSMLDALLAVLKPTSLVAIASDKRQKVVHEGYQRVEHFQLGKRRVTFLQPVP
jgi:23S rRNA (guanine2535-N1)-methyltransferase